MVFIDPGSGNELKKTFRKLTSFFLTLQGLEDTSFVRLGAIEGKQFSAREKLFWACWPHSIWLKAASADLGCHVEDHFAKPPGVALGVLAGA